MSVAAKAERDETSGGTDQEMGGRSRLADELEDSWEIRAAGGTNSEIADGWRGDRHNPIGADPKNS